jgi:hypothetical protein
MPIIRPHAARSALLPDEPLAPQRGRPGAVDATLRPLMSATRPPPCR